MPVLMDNVETNAGILHRVRVGPFDQAEEADRAVAAIRARIPDLNPRVMDLRPDESAPVTVPSDPLLRWVVQVGSFGEAVNAEKLVYRLRDAGYRASSVTVTSATGTVYIVRVGPEIERQNAVPVGRSQVPCWESGRCTSIAAGTNVRPGCERPTGTAFTRRVN